MITTNKLWNEYNRLTKEVDKEQDVTKKLALAAKKRELYGRIRSSNLISSL